jgi:hypothetical protein
MKDNMKTISHNVPRDNFAVADKKPSTSNPNIILNQNGVPCFNNIHIYTSGKQGDINLKQFIVSKMHRKTNSLVKGTHMRSASTSGH